MAKDDPWQKFFKEAATTGGREVSVARQPKVVVIAQEPEAKVAAPKVVKGGKEEKIEFRSGAVSLVGELEAMEKSKYAIGFTTMFLVVAALVVNFIYIPVKYLNVSNYDPSIDPFIIQNLINGNFIFAGVVMHVLIVNRRLKFAGAALGPLLLIIPCTLIIALLEYLTRTLVKVSVSGFDLYFFYASVAIGEEMFFRFGLQATLDAFIRQRTHNAWLGAILSIGIVSAGFMALHVFVYTTWQELLSVMAIGATLGVFFRIAKNTDTNVISHVIINVIATAAIIAAGLV